MSDRPRPASLHRGPAPTQSPTPPPENSEFRALMIRLADGRSHAAMPIRETAMDTLDELRGAIMDGRTIALHDPSGTVTVLNPAHIVSLELGR